MTDSHHAHIKVNLSALEDQNMVSLFAHLLREAGGVALVEATDEAGNVAFMTYPCDCQGRSE